MLPWFDGYDGEEIVVLDDLRKCKDMPLDKLIRILGNGMKRVPVKNGSVAWNPRVIIITMPRPPEDGYKQAKRVDG